MAQDKDLEKTAKLFRQLIHVCIQQELDELGLLPKTKSLKNTPGRVIKPKLPVEVARDREQKVSRALGLG